MHICIYAWQQMININDKETIMSKEVFESIKVGLEDAIAYTKLYKTRGTIHHPEADPTPQCESPIRLSKEKVTKT